MDALLRKKINLLVHLAKIDGKLDQSEQDMLLQILKEHQMDEFDWNAKTAVDLNDFKNAPSKAEVLYLALRMVRADGIIHPDEVAYCKALSIKLDFDPALIDRYTNHEFPTLAAFKQEIKQWQRA